MVYLSIIVRAIELGASKVFGYNRDIATFAIISRNPR